MPRIALRNVMRVCVSGGFTILHVGHIRLFHDAAKVGRVIVILNSDAWLERKYGCVVVPYEQRREVLLALRDVSAVVEVDDGDGTVCEALRRLRPEYFANGGDRLPRNTPEVDLCHELGIKPLWGIGGGKVASSSALMGRAHD